MRLCRGCKAVEDACKVWKNLDGSRLACKAALVGPACFSGTTQQTVTVPALRPMMKSSFLFGDMRLSGSCDATSANVLGR